MLSDIKAVLKAMKEAKESPSEMCAEGKSHDFQFLSHADGMEHYMNYFRCSHCNEVLVQKHKRTGMDKLLWQ